MLRGCRLHEVVVEVEFDIELASLLLFTITSTRRRHHAVTFDSSVPVTLYVLGSSLIRFSIRVYSSTSLSDE